MENNLTINKLIECRIPEDRNAYILSHIQNMGYKKSYSLVDDTTLIGIEVEVERINTANNVTPMNLLTVLWKNIEDGSLRNNGREFVSAPIKGAVVPFAIQSLAKFLNTTTTCIGHEFSERTSVHVHMNVQDMTVSELMSLIYTYLIVEPLLYNFIGNDRNNNIFCIPITQSCLTKELKRAIKYLEDGDLSGCLKTLSGWMKYTGFNLAPIGRFGTVEFRHMYGTIDETILINWINIILSIKKFALRNNHKELLNRIFLMNTNSEYAYFIQEVFGELSSLFSMELQDSIEPCVIFLKDLHYNKDTNDLLKSKKEYVKNPFGSSLIQQLLKLHWVVRVDIEKEIIELEHRISDDEKELLHLNSQKEKCRELLKDKTISPSDKSLYKKQFISYEYNFNRLYDSVVTLKYKLENLKSGEDSELEESPNYDSFLRDINTTRDSIFNQGARPIRARPEQARVVPNPINVVEDVDF